ncbi:hypothetical protein GCM10007895_06310 [Paraferrimonas sedimenticola]|uniref:Helix-turn-helix domain-containing protein n=1 Tax=Paraferrimonas sedimenticola TaxID=375674 RepID=A0AA37RSW9_9GAMM|nr:hypothetical protein GCM10007895_06310 [Paraferrimonas sedimenticola]
MKPILTLQDAHRQLGISRTTFWRLRKKGVIPDPIQTGLYKGMYQAATIANVLKTLEFTDDPEQPTENYQSSKSSQLKSFNTYFRG